MILLLIIMASRTNFRTVPFRLLLNHAEIEVEGQLSSSHWGAAFRSPPTRSSQAAPSVVCDALGLFALSPGALDARLPPAVIHGGGDHLLLALKERTTLSAMEYDLSAGQVLAAREGFVTFTLVHVEAARVFHARNPFPLSGVYEDPATGAATAALAGYLRDLGWPHGGSIVVHQGVDMNVPSKLNAEIGRDRGEGIRVSGDARLLREPEDLQVLMSR